VENKQTRFSNQSNNHEDGEWWNNAILYSWPQLSEFMVIKVTKFLNNLFKVTSTMSIIKNLQVLKVDLGQQPPEPKNIYIKKDFDKQGDSILVSQFDLSWISNSSIVILLQLNILGRSQVHCVLSNISLRGNMTIEMSGLVPAIPHFSKVKCYFIQRPVIMMELKFKNSSLGTVRVSHSRIIGQAIASLVKDRLIEEACKELTYPRGVEIDVRD
jgi:hypothetical protein